MRSVTRWKASIRVSSSSLTGVMPLMRRRVKRNHARPVTAAYLAVAYMMSSSTVVSAPGSRPYAPMSTARTTTTARNGGRCP